MDTIQDFKKEINKWLKLQWQKADTIQEMPTLEQTAEYMTRTLDCWTNSNDRSMMQKINKERAGLGLPITNASLAVITLWDFVVDKDAKSIRMVTAKGTENERTLCIFTTVMKHLEIEEDAADSVKSIDAVDSDKALSLEQLVHTASGLLSSIDHGDITNRWLSANNTFRRNHPICPVCQAEVRKMGRYEDTAQPMTCDCCGWTSYQKYYYVSEFTELDAFLKERASTIREAKYIDDMDKSIEDLDMAIKKVKAICTKKKAPAALKGSYLDKLQGIFKKAMDDMAAEKMAIQKRT